jgi:hypothetical protein
VLQNVIRRTSIKTEIFSASSSEIQNDQPPSVFRRLPTLTAIRGTIAQSCALKASRTLVGGLPKVVGPKPGITQVQTLQAQAEKPLVSSHKSSRSYMAASMPQTCALPHIILPILVA